MNIILPNGLSKIQSDEITQQLFINNNSELSTDQKIIKILKDHPQNMIDFFNACIHDKTYAEQHQNLIKKLLKQLDSSYIKRTLSIPQMHTLLNSINNHPDLLSQARCFHFIHGDQKFSIPRMKLYLESSYFEEQVASGVKKDGSNIYLDDISLDATKIIVDYLNENASPQTGTLPYLNDAQVIDEVMLKASLWNLKSLLNQFPKILSSQNALAIWHSANRHRQNDIKRVALDYLYSQSYDLKEIISIHKYCLEKNLLGFSSFCQDIFLNFLEHTDRTFFSDDNDFQKLVEFGHKFYIPFSKEQLSRLDHYQVANICHFFPAIVRELDLAYGDNEVESIVEHLPNRVKNLRIPDVALTEEETYQISRCKRLKKLDLSNCVKRNKNDSEKFFEVNWSDLKKIEGLKLLNFNDSPEALPHVKSIIMQSPNLEELSLNQEPYYNTQKILGTVGDEFCETLGKYCPKLKVLSAENIPITQTGITALASNDSIMNGLSQIALSAISSDHKILLGHNSLIELGTKFPNLKSLKLNNLSFHDNQVFQKMVQNLPNLEEIDLHFRKPLNSDPLMFLALNCPKLRKIKCNTDLKFQTCKTLVNNCPHLTSLNIKSIKAKSFDFLLDSNIKLSELHFEPSYNLCQIINEERLLKLAQQWPGLKTLSLPLKGPQISKDCLIKTFSSFDQMTDLEIYVNEDNTENFINAISELSNLSKSLNPSSPALDCLKKIKKLTCTCSPEAATSLLKWLPHLEYCKFHLYGTNLGKLIKEIVRHQKLKTLSLINLNQGAFLTASDMENLRITSLNNLSIHFGNQNGNFSLLSIPLIKNNPHLKSIKFFFQNKTFQTTRRLHDWEKYSN